MTTQVNPSLHLFYIDALYAPSSYDMMLLGTTLCSEKRCRDEATSDKWLGTGK